MAEDRGHRRRLPPLDRAALEAAALAHVGRFQTTRARLERLLRAKVRARGWAEEEPPPFAAIAERLAALGFIDEAAYAEARAHAMAARGLGARRVAQRLRADGVEHVAPPAASEEEALDAATRYAQRRRLGRFGPPPADQRAARRQMAAMLRAGHAPGVARAVLGQAVDGSDDTDDTEETND
ncbi:RecX family transcriptional regulator [Thermaurantiacus sp.]